MTCKNTTNIAIFGIVALLTITPFAFSNVLAEESNDYKMIGDVSSVLTFTFREGVEVYEFPVFEMGENFAANSGTSFSVEGTVTKSPLLHKAMDEAYKYRLSNAAFDHQFKYFDVDADFVKDDRSILSLDYNNCRIENYQIETLDSNDYESYFKDIGFAIVDKIDFVCSGVNIANVEKSTSSQIAMADFGSSGFNFANDVKPLATFKFDSGIEKIEFPVFNLISAYEESTENVVAEFQLEGVLEYYPLLYNAIDKSRKVSGISSASNIDFDVLVEFSNSDSVLRGLDFKNCRVSDAKITTQKDKEEGFTGKSGFVLVQQLTFTCSGFAPINMHYAELLGDGPSWKVSQISNEYIEPLQNTDKGLRAVSTFTFADGIEKIEFSMFTQSDVLTSTVDTGSAITDKPVAPTLELRGIVGDYPMLYNYVDKIRKVQGVGGTQFKDLADIDVKIISGEEVIRDFNYQNCRPTDYRISTNTNSEESYVKNSFAIESIFDFECQGYHPNNPVYDAMFDVKKANTESSKNLRNTDQWRDGFTVRK